MRKLWEMNKATVSVLVALVVMLINKYTGLGLDLTEQGIATAAISGALVWLVPNVFKA